MTRYTSRLAVIAIAVALVFSSVPAGAQDDSPAFWGPGPNYLFVSAEEFQSENSGNTIWAGDFEGFWTVAGVAGISYAPVRLPPGSLITGMTVIYRDEEPDVDVNLSVRLFRSWVEADGTAGRTLIGSEFWSSGAPGITSTWVDIDPDHTIKYIDGSTAQSYTLSYYSTVAGILKLRGVIIHWNRQISPAPATATFPDVPTTMWAFQYVEALVASGITQGMPDGLYHPYDPVTRAQLATFLSRALGLHWPN